MYKKIIEFELLETKYQINGKIIPELKDKMFEICKDMHNDCLFKLKENIEEELEDKAYIYQNDEYIESAKSLLSKIDKMVIK